MQNAKIKMKNDYKELRDKYLPKKLNAILGTIFLMESPPESGKYFYDETGKPNESLFSAMMSYVLFIKTSPTKKEGLEEFAKRGYFLVDATYVPVDGIQNLCQRDCKIMKNYDNLVKDLHEIIGNKKVKIILVKKNICRLFQEWEPLRNEGFDIVNNGENIPFPSHGWQAEFAEKVKRFL